METFPLDVAPDWGLETSVEANIETQELGDGYELNRPKGINYHRQSCSPSWPLLEKDQCQDAYQWLKERLRITPFLWEHPTTGIVHRVKCQSVGMAASEPGIFSLRASFREDFNI